jgi:hypothetical protein
VARLLADVAASEDIEPRAGSILRAVEMITGVAFTCCSECVKGRDKAWRGSNLRFRYNGWIPYKTGLEDIMLVRHRIGMS